MKIQAKRRQNPNDARACPYCREEVHLKDVVICCGECHVFHHHDCWLETRCCSVCRSEKTLVREQDQHEVHRAAQLNRIQSQEPGQQRNSQAIANDPKALFAEESGVYDPQIAQIESRLARIEADVRELRNFPQQRISDLFHDIERLPNTVAKQSLSQRLNTIIEEIQLANSAQSFRVDDDEGIGWAWLYSVRALIIWPAWIMTIIACCDPMRWKYSVGVPIPLLLFLVGFGSVGFMTSSSEYSSDGCGPEIMSLAFFVLLYFCSVCSVFGLI